MRKAFIHIILLLFPALAAAQYAFIKPELAIGTNQGVVLLSQVGFDPSVEQSFTFNYTGGLTVRYIIQKHFGLQAELNFSRRGWSETSVETGERFNRTLDYLELPLISHIYFGNKNVRFFVNLGPKIRYMVHESATAPFSQNAGIQQTKPIENRFDYSIFGGLGIEFRTQKAGFFQLEARYDFGLGNIFNSGKQDYFSASNNTGITVSVAYLFDVLKNKEVKPYSATW